MIIIRYICCAGRFKESSFSYQIEELDRDLVEESCSMMHGGPVPSGSTVARTGLALR